jgi:hypothetical protein
MRLNAARPAATKIHISNDFRYADMPLSPDDLIANPGAAELLAACSYEIAIEPEGPAWFAVDGIPVVRQIGQDGAGGIFALLPPTQRVLYVTSEGQAGIIAADFEAFIQLIVSYPYWHDLLTFSGNGQLAQMRRAATALEATLDDEEQVNDSRDLLRSRFPLVESTDHISALHLMVSSSDVVVRPPDGEPFTTLFNSFTIDNNPFLVD